jgi:hypothetical protein
MVCDVEIDDTVTPVDVGLVTEPVSKARLLSPAVDAIIGLKGALAVSTCGDMSSFTDRVSILKRCEW